MQHCLLLTIVNPAWSIQLIFVVLVVRSLTLVAVRSVALALAVVKSVALVLAVVKSAVLTMSVLAMSVPLLLPLQPYKFSSSKGSVFTACQDWGSMLSRHWTACCRGDNFGLWGDYGNLKKKNESINESRRWTTQTTHIKNKQTNKNNKFFFVPRVFHKKIYLILLSCDRGYGRPTWYNGNITKHVKFDNDTWSIDSIIRQRPPSPPKKQTKKKQKKTKQQPTNRKPSI